MLRGSAAVPLVLAASALLLFGTVLAGCDAAGSGSGNVAITGRVTDAAGNAVDDARLEVSVQQDGENNMFTTRTDTSGRYRLEIDVEASTEVTVQAFSDDMSAERVLTVFPDEPRTNVNFTLGDSGDDGSGGSEPTEEPGTPAYIQLQSVSSESIQVQETGGTEVARLTFVVRDSADRPISLDYQRPVRFSLGNHPGGGEHLTTEQASTNGNGEATVSLISGTKAGVVQVFAEVEGKDGTIQSRPVAITVHGGFPHKAHFTVAPEQFNFQGLVTAGLENEIRVIVGDRYSNPVKPGTAVYFRSNRGVIEGSAVTDELGRGSVTLQSARPYPDDGVSVITATTVNRSNDSISVKTPVLFTSGGALKVKSIPDQTFAQPLDLEDPADVETLVNALGNDFPFGGYQFIVEDRNGNPLPQGTSIGFRAGGTEVGSDGDVSVTLGDTEFSDQNGDGDALDYADVVRGLGFTDFSASAVKRDNPETAEVPDLESITFVLDGPQSNREYTFVEPNTSPNTASTTSAMHTPSSPALLKNGEVIATWQNGQLRWKR